MANLSPLEAALAATRDMKKVAFQPMMDPQAQAPQGAPPQDPNAQAMPPQDPAASAPPQDPNAQGQAPQDPQAALGQLMGAVDQLTNLVQQQQQQLQQLGQAFPQIQQQIAQMQGELKQTSQIAQAAGQEVAQLAKAINSQPDMPEGMQDPSMGGAPQEAMGGAGAAQPQGGPEALGM